MVPAVVECFLVVRFRLVELFLGAGDCGEALVDGFRHSSEDAGWMIGAAVDVEGLVVGISVGGVRAVAEVQCYVQEVDDGHVGCVQCDSEAVVLKELL